jgi:ATP phosphoribosyltransferase
MWFFRSHKLPKSHSFPVSVALLRKLGLDVAGLAELGRRLIISGKDVEYYLVRSADVPLVVSYDIDCGFCGHDAVVEAGSKVVELVDLGHAPCRYAVLEPEDPTKVRPRSKILRVATKYPNITANYYDKLGVSVQIIKMHGSLELAPFCGVCDCIVDIVFTGTTLRENNLRIVNEAFFSTARFIGNPLSVQADPRIENLAKRLSGASEAYQRRASSGEERKPDV